MVLLERLLWLWSLIRERHCRSAAQAKLVLHKLHWCLWRLCFLAGLCVRIACGAFQQQLAHAASPRQRPWVYLRHQKQMQFRINLFVRSASISCHVAKATVESILCCEIEIHVSLVLDIKELKKKTELWWRDCSFEHHKTKLLEKTRQ